MSHDAIFASPMDEVPRFEFDAEVAEVFDDMISRSVPFYSEIQEMVLGLAREFAKPKSCIVDLGCSTGTSFLHLMDSLTLPGLDYIGVDASPAMLETAKNNLGDIDNLTLRQADLNDGFQLSNASVVLLILTLQFLTPENRGGLLADVYRGLNPGGALIVVEKLAGDSEKSEAAFTRLYYEFKRRQGYSELEISQKRDALEDVLIPSTLDENLTLLRDAGFGTREIFFKWYNFAGFLGVKDE